MRGARRTAGVARGAAVLQPDPSTSLPQCIWCWMEQPDHQLKSCPEKRTPDMSDFKQARAVRTRSVGLQRSRGQPSGCTKVEQQAHEATYKATHQQRTRALVVDAVSVTLGVLTPASLFRVLAADIAADTLMYVAEAGLYVADPDFVNSSKPENRRAHTELIFTVETQPLVAVDGGYQGQEAWRIERRNASAARARARIDGAASDESGHDDEMEE
jgi:hypothetical protein